MLLVFIYGLAIPFYNKRLMDNNENTETWTYELG